MPDINYYHTFIKAAPDCPVTTAQEPVTRNGKPTIASIQFEMIATSPYVYTQEDILFETHLRHKGSAEGLSEQEKAELREVFFSKPMACLRASPLPKQFGWGIHFDEAGRTALVAIEDEQYQKFTERPPEGLACLNAMRNKRGG
ncbi:MAG: hypothetical protein JNN12_16285 [Bacteroidetes Order II. Incertae sedis bacterium]|nr:hypothetical protein [Bacteroidetes Order II. bacterium]